MGTQVETPEKTDEQTYGLAIYRKDSFGAPVKYISFQNTGNQPLIENFRKVSLAMGETELIISDNDTLIPVDFLSPLFDVVTKISEDGVNEYELKDFLLNNSEYLDEYSFDVLDPYCLFLHLHR